MNTMKKDNNFIRWSVYSIEPMTEKEAMLYQTNHGYMPAGYGFSSFKVDKHVDETGRDYYNNTWACYSSCD